jgi:DNA-binding response OmpR family regulator
MSASRSPDIVVMEDDSIMREAMTEWLQAAGYGVRAAVDGSAGLEAVRFAAPALVVTDMHMPRTDGWRVIAEMRHRYPGVPVVAVSGQFSEVDMVATLALGASRVLVKPFKRTELLLAVADLLRG